MKRYLGLLLLIGVSNALPCALRKYPHGYVCVCNSTYCDSLETVNPDGINDFALVSSSEGGLRFSVMRGNFDDDATVVADNHNGKETASNEPFVALIERGKKFFNNWWSNEIKDIDITIDRSVEYQTIVGFGGALTTAVSYNLDKISEKLKTDIYNAYFSEHTGIGYNFIRISIGGCDFDLEPWAYNEYPENDVHLTNFTKLDPRDEAKIQKIKQIMETTNNYAVKIVGAAWSPPVWMKSNRKWTGTSHLLEEYYQTWADYHIRFLELMDSKNISLWAISTGNEPGNGNVGAIFVHFMSLGWRPTEQGVWVGRNMGPTLRNSKFKNVKLFAPDDQRYNVPSWLDEMDKSYAGSSSYIDGIAVHFYWDDIFPPSLLEKAHNEYGDKLLLNTESCVGDKPWETHGPELGSWARAEKYIHSYIQDFQHWVNGWIDWNLILDEQGGPNYAENYVDAPIIVNHTSGEEIYKQPIFYGIGHFSKFITPNSVKIKSYSSDSDIETVAFKKPEGNVAAIVLNKKDTSIRLVVSDSLRGKIVLEIPPKSVHTLVYN